MATSSNFLETEQVLNDLVNELTHLRSMAEQLETVSKNAGLSVKVAEDVTLLANQVLINSKSMLSEIQNAHFSERLGSLSENGQSLGKSILRVQNQVNETQDKINEALNQNKALTDQISSVQNKQEELENQTKTLTEEAKVRDNQIYNLLIKTHKVSNLGRALSIFMLFLLFTNLLLTFLLLISKYLVPIQ